MKKRLLLAAVYAVQGISASGKPPQNLAELKVEIENVLRTTHTPGAAVALASRDRIEWVAGFGLADVASQRPATATTLFRIGSISKGFVALAALKLQEEGRLKLTDPLRQWLPDCAIENPWDSTDPIRLVHLLEHTSGLSDMRFSEYAHSAPTPVTTAEALSLVSRHRHARWRPGSRGAYSNAGVFLAAAMIERACGQRFEDYVREKLFVPLGMTTATYFLMPGVAQSLATTYQSDGRTVMPYTHLVYRPAGAINASAADMANYLRFFLQRGRVDGRPILQASSIDRMEVPDTLPAAQAGVTTGYGLCNAAVFALGSEIHGHGGEVDGGLAAMGYFSELGLGRVVMINAKNPGALGRLIRLVDSYLLRDRKPIEPPPAVALSPDLQKSLGGCYANIAPQREGFMRLGEYFGSIRRVRADDRGMTWQPLFGGPGARWVSASGKLFRRENATKPALAVITGETSETLLQSDEGTLQRLSPAGLWLIVGGLFLSILLLASAVLFALVWVPRQLFGRLRAPEPLAVRGPPLLGALSFLAFVTFYAQAGAGGLAVLGTPNFWTVGMTIFSLGIAVGAIVSVICLWRHRRSAMNRIAYWHSGLVTLALVFITGFGLHWGMIGVRLWA